MLIGQYATRITRGRRVAIPKKFRVELGKKMIVAKWYEGCLVLNKIESWEGLLSRLTGRTKVITTPVRDTDRFILGSAYEVEVDNQGRVVLHEALVAYAGLTGAAVFVGLGDRVEIWDEKKWRERERFISENAAGLVEELVEIQKDG